jgi:hypothetical protein
MFDWAYKMCELTIFGFSDCCLLARSRHRLPGIEFAVSCKNRFNFSFSFNKAEIRKFSFVYNGELKLFADGSSFAWLSDATRNENWGSISSSRNTIVDSPIMNRNWDFLFWGNASQWTSLMRMNWIYSSLIVNSTSKCLLWCGFFGTWIAVVQSPSECLQSF